MAGSNGNNANSASVEVEVEAELGKSMFFEITEQFLSFNLI